MFVMGSANMSLSQGTVSWASFMFMQLKQLDQETAFLTGLGSPVPSDVPS